MGEYSMLKAVVEYVGYKNSSNTFGLGYLRGLRPPEGFLLGVEMKLHLSANNLARKRFGRLIVKQPTEKRSKNRQIYWECLCDCGKTVYIRTDSLTTSNTRSCGCLQRETAGRLSWKGGRRIDNGGYILIYKPNHPYNVNKYVMEHRLVIEEELGRYLLPTERVHHANKIKDDNSPENLVHFSTESDHQKYEWKLRKICEET